MPVALIVDDEAKSLAAMTELVEKEGFSTMSAGSLAEARDQHARLRLAATWAIQQSRDVVATIYGAAGSNAVFNENPFERRLRDIHAGTQQGQGRPVHFETVGQILLGLPPEGRMFR